MDRMHRWVNRSVAARVRRVAMAAAAPLVLSLSMVQPCHADSDLQGRPPSSGSVSASAHLNFRITVLPSLALSTQGAGLRVQGNSGVLTLQHEQRSALDGQATAASTQLRPRNQVVDLSMPGSDINGSTLITVASP